MSAGWVREKILSSLEKYQSEECFQTQSVSDIHVCNGLDCIQTKF